VPRPAKSEERGWNLAVFNLKPSHVELRTEAKPETAFEVFHREQAAISSFFRFREVQRHGILEFVESRILKGQKP
jgi:hypothetical protein